MTAFTFEMSDVERLGATLDERCADLDERDRALLHAVFAWAGQAVGADTEEVEGFAADTPTSPSLLHSFCCNGSHFPVASISWGASGGSGAG